MLKLNVAIPPALERWVDARVAEGRYADASDYVRDLVRRDQDRAAADTSWLQAMIDEGAAAPMLEAEADAVLDDVLAEDADFRD